MRRRFFVDSFDANSATMRGSTAEHLGRVLRAEAGQLYELSDGHLVWLARIERVALSKRGDNRIDFALVELIVAREPSLDLVLLISLVKFDRFEWCLEKATELGATGIIPLAAARTDKPLRAAAEKRRERWERILLESAQQARRLRPPALRAPISPAEAFAHSTSALKIILSERRDAPSFREVLDHHATATTGASSAASTAALAIGPEGGWTDEEIAAAHAAGFAKASLGENILRTETAVIASLAILRFALSSDE
jgi:16S rRNA (uracil1498-N3)-methyltransferase